MFREHESTPQYQVINLEHEKSEKFKHRTRLETKDKTSNLRKNPVIKLNF